MSLPVGNAVFTNLKGEDGSDLTLDYCDLETLSARDDDGIGISTTMFKSEKNESVQQSHKDSKFPNDNNGKRNSIRSANERPVTSVKRSFKNKWLCLPEIKDWIVVFSDRSNYVGCKWCNAELRAHLHDLKKHSKSTKHRKCMVLSRINSENCPIESIALETGDCHDGLSCLESNISVNHDELIIDEPGQYTESSYKQNSLAPVHIGFIGAGNIAQALLSGFISSGVVEANNIIVSAPSKKNLNKLKSVGIRTTHDNNQVVQECDIIFLALRPMIVAEVLANIDPITKPESPLFVSVITGLTILHLEGMLTSHSISNPRVIRIIPNTSCMVLQGLSVYTLGSNATPSEGSMVKNMLNSIGLCSKIPESQMDAASGLCGSGPAYIYAAIDALADGAVKMGINREVAVLFAAQMVKGAATMVLETGRHPCQLKDEVCCPLGSAIAGMHVLEKNGFRDALMSAVEVAALKSSE